MDLHQADRLRDELREFGTDAAVDVKPDLWDLPAEFNTVLCPSPPRGDRELKRDMVEQAYHVLRPRGLLVVLSPVPKDQFFPAVMKKAFGKVALETGRDGTVLWSPRGGDHPRRRHEITFQVRFRASRERQHRWFSNRRCDARSRHSLSLPAPACSPTAAWTTAPAP